MFLFQPVALSPTPRTDLTTVSRGTVIRLDTDAFSLEHLRCWAMRMARDLAHACMVYARF